MQNFEMTDDQLAKIRDACKPTPVMFLSGGRPMGTTPQENANRAWAELGKELGFKPMTVRPRGDNPRCFSAETIEEVDHGF